MSQIKKISKKVGSIIICFFLLIGVGYAVLVYFCVSRLIQEIKPVLQADANLSAGMELWNLLLAYQPQFWYTLFPAMMIITMLVGLLTWLFARSSIQKLDGATGQPAQKIDSRGQTAEDTLAERRMFLHLFALMQREGRLMDFLAEDLDRYDDAQIGSAVRSIHAGCRQLVKDYLKPKPVMDQEEGAEVSVPVDFDPGAIKLTGNVVGEPPFRGILRHKGWQVGKLKLPTLAGRQNAEIIAPAEVEIS
jgi:hypothetical protein